MGVASLTGVSTLAAGADKHLLDLTIANLSQRNRSLLF